MPYQVVFSEEAESHLQFLTVRDQRIVIDAIEEQLPYEPTVLTKNRQPMRSNPVAAWKLRIGNLRVYYDVEEPEQMVQILAIGIKERNKVKIGDRYIDL